VVRGIPPTGANPLGAGRNIQPMQSVGATLVSTHPSLALVLKALQISPQNVSKVSSHAGVDRLMISNSLTQIQTLSITAEQAHILSALGLAGATVAISIQSKEELEKLKKRLKNLIKPNLKSPHLQTVFGTLGLPFDDDTSLFLDDTGGVFVIQAGLSELES